MTAAPANAAQGAAAYESLAAMFFVCAERDAEAPRYLAKQDGRYVPTSWSACRARVEGIAAGLLRLGLQPASRIAILSATRPEWMEADLAVLAIGCITIPIYPSDLAEECGYILLDSGARTVFVENAELAEKIHEAVAKGVKRDAGQAAVPVDHIIVLQGQAAGCLSLDELCGSDEPPSEALTEEIQRRTQQLGPADLATIVYTSGTTGLPKGVMQTHGNHLAALRAVAELGIVSKGEIDFAYLPLAHSFGRMVEYLAIYLGTVTAFAERIDTITADLALARPHFMPSVPRIFEKIYAAIQQARAQQGAVRRCVFDCAVAVGAKRAAYANRGQSVPWLLRLADRVAQHLVFAKIQERLGGRLRFLISGGAPLASEINRFFHAVGLPILEGYGLTETTPILTCNVPGRTRIGTVGPPVPGVTLRIVEDGEILAKGPNIASGYYKRPEETAEAWDDEGWFHTGDIGTLDDGFLLITDRKKELIKTAGGKYVAPQKIENLLKSQALISQAVVVGDRLKYCVALLTLDPDAIRAWAESNDLAAAGAEELFEHPSLQATVKAEVEAVNRHLASFETVKYFRIVPREFSIEGGELTPSLKVKRRVVTEKYAGLIAAMVPP